MDCKKKANLAECSCTYPGCEKKGLCCDCVSYHRKKGQVPACFFSKSAEKSFDRSVKYFVESWHNIKSE